MRAKTTAAVLALAAVVGMSLPAAAGAEGPASRHSKVEVTKSVKLKGTNGFEISASLGVRRELLVQASKFDKHARSVSSAIYFVRAQPQSAEGFVARIGDLGRIDMRFVPESSKETAAPAPCTGADRVVETGHYVGFASFRGEHGYTRVRTHRAAGTVTRQPEWVCRHRKKKARHTATVKREAEIEAKREAKEAEESEEVQIKASSNAEHVSFQATRETSNFTKRATTATRFTVTASRQGDGLTEAAVVLAFFGKGSAFKTTGLEGPTEEASVSPPAPFLGSATFQSEEGKATRWTGDLRAELPGFGVVQLTGLDFKASLCQAPNCEGAGSGSFDGGFFS